MTLVLGPVAFRDFEIPPDVSFGMAQAITIHKLAGGGRVVDAMGEDPAPIRWKGRMRGPQARSRARSLYNLSRTGATVPLSWGGFFFLVVIARFEFRYENFREIEYDAEVEVVSSGAGGAVLASLGALVGADVSSLATVVGRL